MQENAVPLFKTYVNTLAQHALQFVKHLLFYAIDLTIYAFMYYIVPYGVTFTLLGTPIQYMFTVLSISLMVEWTFVFLVMTTMTVARSAAAALRDTRALQTTYLHNIGMLDATVHFCQTLLLYDRYDPWLHIWIYALNTLLAYKVVH